MDGPICATSENYPVRENDSIGQQQYMQQVMNTIGSQMGRSPRTEEHNLRAALAINQDLSVNIPYDSTYTS